MNLGILPISLLFDYRAATYCHSIMNKKKPTFSSSALKLPTASFYIHERTQKIFTQTISKCYLHDKNIFKRGILQHNSQEIIWQCHTVLQRRNISSFFVMNTRRTRRKPNIVQLLGNILSSIKFLFLVLNLCYCCPSPPIQVTSLFGRYFSYYKLLVFSVGNYQYSTLPISVNFTMTETFTDIRRNTVLLF